MHRAQVLAFVTAALLLLQSPAFGDWPQYLGPDRTGHADSRGIKLVDSFGDAGPKEAWQVALGEGFCGPAIHNGELIVLDRVDDTKDVLRGFDLATGKAKWTFEYEAPARLNYNGSRATPTVTDEHIFIVGPLGHMHCLERDTRKVVWKRNLLEDFKASPPRWAVSQSPLLYKDMVIVAPMGSEGTVVAMKQSDGSVVWTATGHGDGSYTSPTLHTVDGVDTVVQTTQNHVFGLDAATGKHLWSYRGWKCRIPIPPATALGDGRFFITGGYKGGSAMIQVKKSDDGTFKVDELYTTMDIQGKIHPAVIVGEHMYINSSDNGVGLSCFDFAGKQQWAMGGRGGSDMGSVIVVGDRVLHLGGGTGILHMAVATPDGFKELGKAKVVDAKQAWAPIAFGNGYLAVRDFKGLLRVFDLRAE